MAEEASLSKLSDEEMAEIQLSISEDEIGNSLRAAITPREMLFALAVVQGYGAMPAAKKALGCEDSKTKGGRIYQWSCQVRKKPEVRAYIDYLRREIEQYEYVRSLKEKLIDIQNIIADEKVSHRDRLDAIKVHNQMLGHNAPQKIEGEITFETILNSLNDTTGIDSMKNVTP